MCHNLWYLQWLPPVPICFTGPQHAQPLAQMSILVPPSTRRLCRQNCWCMWNSWHSVGRACQGCEKEQLHGAGGEDWCTEDSSNTVRIFPSAPANLSPAKSGCGHWRGACTPCQAAHRHEAAACPRTLRPLHAGSKMPDFQRYRASACRIFD